MPRAGELPRHGAARPLPAWQTPDSRYFRSAFTIAASIAFMSAPSTVNTTLPLRSITTFAGMADTPYFLNTASLGSCSTGKVAFTWRANAPASFNDSSLLTETTVKPLGPYFFCRLWR